MKRTLYAAALALACAIAVLSPAHAQAGTTTLTWTAPATYTDTTAIPAGDLSGYRAIYGLCPDAKTLPASPTSVSISGGTTLTFTITGLQDSPPKTQANPNPTPTIYCFALFAESSTHGESAQTNVVSSTMPPPPPPNPPGGLAVTATTAYQLKASPNGPRLASIGQVPLGTACDQTVSVTVGGATYYAVPSIDVAFSNSGSGTRSTIYAQCGAT